MDSLIRKNWYAFWAHVGVLVGVAILFAIKQPKSDLELTREGVPGPTETSGTNFNPKCDINFPLKIYNVASLNVYRGVMAFFAITAVAHLTYATDGFGSGLYTSMIQAGWNWVRWLEYGLSAGIMTFLIASLDGTRNFPTLLALSLLTIAMQLNGLSVESILRYHKQFNPEAVLANTISGWILFVALWFVILYNFISVIQDVKTLYPNDPNAEIPAWLYFIGPLQLFYYATFGVVQLVQVNDRFKGLHKSFEKYESWYILLSFLSKISLAAGIAYGLAFRQNGC